MTQQDNHYQEQTSETLMGMGIRYSLVSIASQLRWTFSDGKQSYCEL